ncbi:hypothetical protein RI367_007777 [Sorochytrium milnesiophthora]
MNGVVEGEALGELELKGVEKAELELELRAVVTDADVNDTGSKVTVAVVEGGSADTVAEAAVVVGTELVLPKDAEELEGSTEADKLEADDVAEEDVAVELNDDPVRKPASLPPEPTGTDVVGSEDVLETTTELELIETELLEGAAEVDEDRGAVVDGADTKEVEDDVAVLESTAVVVDEAEFDKALVTAVDVGDANTEEAEVLIAALEVDDAADVDEE